jgi:hypothetical protein
MVSNVESRPVSMMYTLFEATKLTAAHWLPVVPFAQVSVVSSGGTSGVTQFSADRLVLWMIVGRMLAPKVPNSVSSEPDITIV